MAPSKRDIKWNIFRAICYLQIVGSIGLFIHGMVQSEGFRFATLAEFILFIIFAAFYLGAFAGNGFSNLYLIEKFMPNQLPSKAAFRLNLILYFINIVVSGFLIVLTSYMLLVMFEREYSQRITAVLSYFINITLALASIPVWFLQIHLRNNLRTNYYHAFDQFLEKENP